MVKERKNQCKILQNLYQFYEELFSKKVFNSNEVVANYLKDISLSKLTKEQSEQCEGEITKNEVKDALGNMIWNATLGNDGFTSEFHRAFWSELKSPMVLSYRRF